MGLVIDDFVLVICWHCSYKGVYFSLPTNGILVKNECFWKFDNKFRKIHKKLGKYAFEDFLVKGLAIWTFEGAKRRTTSRHAQRALCEYIYRRAQHSKIIIDIFNIPPPHYPAIMKNAHQDTPKSFIWWLNYVLEKR